MNWFTLAGTILHVLKNVPELVDEVEEFFQTLSGKETPPDEVIGAVSSAIDTARKG